MMGMTAGWPAGVRTGTNGLDSINMASGPSDLIGIGLAPGVLPSSKLEVMAVDAAAAAVLDTLSVSHSTSATATSGIGVAVPFRIQNGSGIMVRAAALRSLLTTVTNGAEVSTLEVQALSGGALATVAKFNGAGYLEMPKNPGGSLTAFLLSAASDQQLQKNGGAFGFGTTDANPCYLFAGNTAGINVRPIGGAGSAMDVALGKAAYLGNADTGGFLFIPAFINPGAPSGTPTFTGQQASHVAMAFNVADNKLWVHNSGAWKSVTLT